jgi:hypothetical protein
VPSSKHTQSVASSALFAASELIEQCFKVASAVHHPENENVRSFDAINNDVFAHGKAARAGAEIFIPGASDVRKGGEKRGAAGDRSISRVATCMLALSLAT